LEDVSAKIIAIDNDLEDVNSEIVRFCNELGIVPPFKVEDKE